MPRGSVDFFVPEGEPDGASKRSVPQHGRDNMEMSTNIGLRRVESMETLNLTLHQCARDGNPDKLRRLLDYLGNVKKKINAHDENKLSPLHYAARYNHFEAVRILVERGADVNNKGEDDLTPLHFAARFKRMKRIKSTDSLDEVEGSSAPLTPSSEATVETAVSNEEEGADGENVPNGAVREEVTSDDELDNQPSVVKYLVERGAKVNAQDYYGLTPLHFAAMRGNDLVSRELLSVRGIDIEATDKQQMTALHLAATHSCVEVSQILIEAGANLRCIDDELSTPLHLAAEEGNIKIVRMLFEAGQKKDGWVTLSQMVTDQNVEKSTALHLAVNNSHYEVAKLILEKGGDANATANNFSTPLHLASVGGDVRVVQLLLDSNARVDALNHNQETPLHKAAENDHSEVVELLLKSNADIEKRDKDNFTPLLLAACWGNPEVVKVLLRYNADPSAVDKNDKTAIFWAAEDNHVSCLQVLLGNPKVSKLIDEADRYGNTPLHIAAQLGHINCVKLLMEYNAMMDDKNEDEQTPLHLAAMHGRTLVVRELVNRQKTIVNDEDEESNTALHLAALAGHQKVMDVLLDLGADVEARNAKGWTALDCAAYMGKVKAAKTLLEADSPIDPLDRNKVTPLHLAAKGGHTELVELLIKMGANVAQRDHDGLNCLDMAIDCNHENVAMAIVKTDKWEEAMKNQIADVTKGLVRDTPLRKLIRKMPDVAEKVFNNCMKPNMTNLEHKDCEITFNYEYLDDMYADWGEKGTSDAGSSSGSIYDEDTHIIKPDVRPYSKDSRILKKNHPLQIMVSSKREDLLSHPLVSSLLKHKWHKFGAAFYYINLIFYCVFLTFLTGYMLVHEPPYMLVNYTAWNGTDIYTVSCQELASFGLHQPVQYPIAFLLFGTIGKWIVLALAVLTLVRELFQICYSKLNYLNVENFIEWLIYVPAILLVIDWDSCQMSNPQIRHPWQWNVGAIALFLAWIELLLFIRKLPRFGIYVVMFTDILWTFCQFFLVFVLFIVAFGLTFHVLLKNQAPFSSPARSLLKTAVMMIGEFEFDTQYTTEITPEGQNMHSDQVYYEGVTYAIFILFLVLMSILIMNLLVGLAVDDIKAVQDQAVLKRLAMQIDLALDVENQIPGFLRRRMVIKQEALKPNQQSWFTKDKSLTSASIAQALQPELDRMDYIEEQQELTRTDIWKLKGQVKALKSSTDRIETMMTALMKHNEINWEEEDDVDDQDELNLASLGI
ncbi:transient receptor potential cation channel subfamily A member 1 homolog isoform X2 [Lingula anatina]|uniref:Transient receptor potential cation channel subfamily A member 1 homolog isoform X2 n=1 Tax=Lingula anatina TaxID=7574 RepID=A0A1S3J6X3_LINAN|nr:transient receptor potential cation channel subfamily A member 1 homolog isoform X2 [Lingula anatina]|eukprot:XP_013406001.1 transient receptor potential cation channel subfamily A member 1 homolog isoform X2 [Lingula anatina]